MDRKSVKLSPECNSCIKIKQDKCRGKKSVTPCILYVSDDTYKQNKIAEIKDMVRNKL